MFDVKSIEKEAQEELAKEMGNAAKTKIKASLRTIAMAERALLNARQEHEALMRDIGAGDVAAALDMREQEYVRSIVLNVQVMLGEQVNVLVSGDMPAWSPIDAEPRYTTEGIKRLEDLVHFAGPLIRTSEIIIPEESVPELLERILKLQQPARMDRIREELRGERRREQKFHAQIISMQDVA